MYIPFIFPLLLCIIVYVAGNSGLSESQNASENQSWINILLLEFQDALVFCALMLDIILIYKNHIIISAFNFFDVILEVYYTYTTSSRDGTLNLEE
jgi:hypothetical protein